MEHLTDQAEYDLAATYIRGIAARKGVTVTGPV